MELNKIYNEDCLVGMDKIDDKSVDMILCDLPYGTTHNKWDSQIPFDKLWSEYERIIKDNGAMVFTGQGLFSARMIVSNEKLYRYSLIWEKTKAGGFLNARRMPLQAHEDILVFYKKLPTYNPQMTEGHTPVHSYTKHTTDGSCYGETKIGISGGGSTQRYPRDVLQFKWDTQKSSLHPCQKPLEACEYFIKTYTDESDVVLDSCMGSNTTGLACKNLKRRYIGIEKDKDIFNIAEERMKEDV